MAKQGKRTIQAKPQIRLGCRTHRVSSYYGGISTYVLYPLPVDRPPRDKISCNVICPRCSESFKLTISSPERLRTLRTVWLAVAGSLVLATTALVAIIIILEANGSGGSGPGFFTTTAGVVGMVFLACAYLALYYDGMKMACMDGI